MNPTQILSRPEILKRLTPRWNSYIPHKPTAKQWAFLLLPHREAFYGGAAGGGKSDALLMAALQYVDIPGYSAIIFRRTLTELKGADGLIPRSHEWLAQTPAKYIPSDHSWYFPTENPDGSVGTPARLEFGYIGEGNNYTKYQGRAYQFVGWDELTHHFENHYLYLFSRLRKTVCSVHQINPTTGAPNYVPGCPICNLVQQVPLRQRGASNPGGVGHSWVKKRYQIGPHMDPKEAKKRDIELKYIGHNPDRPFIPAFIQDNPYLDQQGYEAGLDELDPITRAQLKKGDWGISQDSRFKAHWARYYSLRGDYYIMGEDGVGEAHHKNEFIRIFATVDPAGSTKEGPGDIENYGESQKKSWTVISVWGLTADYQLLWLDMLRFRREIPDVVKALTLVWNRWGKTPSAGS